MSKQHEAPKEKKKKPAHTMKEKRAAKKQKREKTDVGKQIHDAAE
ncbi:MAG TPA: hypothetical protein VIW02_01320 [Gammaproteobacteria bacterium]